MDAEGARIGCERGHCTPTRWSVPPRREAAARHACRALCQPVHFACSSLCEAVLCEGKIGAASAVDDADVTEVEGRCIVRQCATIGSISFRPPQEPCGDRRQLGPSHVYGPASNFDPKETGRAECVPLTLLKNYFLLL